ncbi:hypothetical protein HPF38_0943, partial [Helicobacter pylori]
MIFFVEIIIII